MTPSYILPGSNYGTVLSPFTKSLINPFPYTESVTELLFLQINFSLLAGTNDDTALPQLILLPPATLFARPGNLSEGFMIACLTPAALAFLYAPRISAASPETKAAA
jgi:hypothetical protein